MKRICIITGTRAEYGLLKPVIERINKDNELELYLIATGAHLSPEFGLTYKEIEDDGYIINKKIEMLLSADTPNSIVKSMGVEMIGLADALEDACPDMVVILGDRYEMLAAASAAMIHRIPIAHIHGGEATEGAIDDAIRHAITKMSYLHFASTEVYRNRIIQLGEEPERAFNVGALGVENIKTVKLLDKETLEKSIDFKFGENTIMVTYHPVTLEKESSAEKFGNLLHVLAKKTGWNIIFTKANSDTDGRIINQMIDRFVAEHKDRCIAYTSLGRVRYLSALKYCSVVIGNSSSGIIEVPSFHIPTVNIGDRQKGRVASGSVIHCGTSVESIDDALDKAMQDDFRQRIKSERNPYESKNTSSEIVRVIKYFLQNGIDMKKKFYDLSIGKQIWMHCL
ncbi:UDP-N-acetyl-D-glucosamine 2-epimerase, UDP-hydrolysing [Dorea sp. 5-2]|nr:UDP-N-acetyl-D-glucosamine 2-epimerase, UDP-hydrolysing [Dorea sp. 5-2]